MTLKGMEPANGFQFPKGTMNKTKEGQVTGKRNRGRSMKNNEPKTYCSHSLSDVRPRCRCRGTRMGGRDVSEGGMMRFKIEEARPDSKKSESVNWCYHNEASKYGTMSRLLSWERRKGEREEHNYDQKISILIEAWGNEEAEEEEDEEIHIWGSSVGPDSDRIMKENTAHCQGRCHVGGRKECIRVQKIPHSEWVLRK